METLSDIVAEMRRGTKLPGYWRSCDLNKILKYHADRIEATWKREVVSKKETTTIGNAAALREALEKVRFYLPYFLQYMRLHWEDTEAGGYYERILEVVNAALSAPARQCDVGTAGEQRVRFESFCNRKGDGFSASAYCAYECPCGNKGDCKLAWAQTPYEAEEGAGNNER